MHRQLVVQVEEVVAGKRLVGLNQIRVALPLTLVPCQAWRQVEAAVVPPSVLEEVNREVAQAAVPVGPSTAWLQVAAEVHLLELQVGLRPVRLQEEVAVGPPWAYQAAGVAHHRVWKARHE